MLENLFTSKIRVKLLGEFLLKPNDEFHIRELSRMIKSTPINAQKELKNLQLAGLLESRHLGNMILYKLRKESPIAEGLKMVFLHAKNEHPTKEGIRYRRIIKSKQYKKTLPKGIRHEVLKRDDFRCVECGATNKQTPLQIDHILPISKGGTDELDNLRTLCNICNISKSDLVHSSSINEGRI
jgi:5-methylcytosine-specific restriction endonuclease McrA